jgi:hypothetical protein
MWRDPQSTNDKEPEAAKSTKVSTTRIELRSNANEMTANLPLASYGKIFRCARASEGFGNLRARRAAPTSQLPVVRASWFVLLWVLWANSSEKSTVHDVRAPRTRKIETRGGQKDATRGRRKKKKGRKETADETHHSGCPCWRTRVRLQSYPSVHERHRHTKEQVSYPTTDC